MFKRIAALLIASCVAACGGGGGSSGTAPFGGTGSTGGTGGSTTASLTVAISSASITATSPATVTMTLTDASGLPVAGAVVTIATSLGLGVFSVGTVLTDSTGVAKAVLQANAAGTGGADTVTASATVNAVAVTGSAGFQVAGTGTSTTPTLAVSISSTSVTPAAPATVTFVLTGADGAPVPNSVVTISTSRQYAVFPVATVLTDSTGTATSQLEVGPTGTNGADDVVASAVVGTDTITGSVAYVVSGGTTTGAAPTTVEVVATANSVGTGGGAITVTAVVKGANNVAIPGTTVSFSTDTGTLSAAGTVTDSTGSATAQFSAGQNQTNRSATITVTAGGAIGTLPLDITGSTLKFTGPSSLTLGTSGTLSVRATNSLGAAVANQAISLKGTLANVPANTSITTDSTGLATYTYAATASGTDTLSLTGLGTAVAPSPQITISGQDFQFTSPSASATVAIGAQQAVAVRYLVNGAVPSGNYTVQFATTGGLFSGVNSATVNVPLAANGTATASLSSTSAGPASVQATLFAVGSTTSLASASLPLQFVATTPSTLTLQVTPSAIGPNLDSGTTNQATVQARVLDANSNPVANVVVNFSRVSDLSGGNLLQATQPTDSNGVAKVQYASGPESTATGGVVLKAEVATNASVNGTTSLTVNQQALSIALGQGNKITVSSDFTRYIKLWTAYVTDSSGAPVANQTLTVSVLPVQYRKGTLAFGTVWGYIPWTGAVGADLSTQANAGHYVSCANEDVNYNGVLDAGEDVNGDNRLEPGFVIAFSGGSGTTTTIQTDSTGFATISLEYAESYALWVQVDLKVSATVAGTESSNDAVFFAQGLADDYSSQTAPPAGVISPFGVIASCTNPN